MTAINEKLLDEPELVNSSPYQDGWMIQLKVKDAGEIDSLLSALEYEDFVKSQSEE